VNKDIFGDPPEGAKEMFPLTAGPRPTLEVKFR